MAPQQNTFSVISNAAGYAGGAPSKRPPMTSKQAQKLYKQANRGPKLSKAEQRKWEKERQEEIRKELEKERAAVKARAARERKKAKEDEARENRRRNGQPLVDCRPSQDTIARFVRGNGTNKKRDSSGEPIPKAQETSDASLEIKSSPSAALVKNRHSASSPHSIDSHGYKPAAFPMAPPPRPKQKSKSPAPAAALTPSQCKAPSVDSVPQSPATLKANSSAPATRSYPTLQPPVRVPAQNHEATPTAMGPPLRPPLQPPPKSKPKRFMMPKIILPTLPSNLQKPDKKEISRHRATEQKPVEQKPVEKPVKQKSSPEPSRILPPPKFSPRMVPSRSSPQMPPVQTPRSHILTPVPSAKGLSPQQPPPSTQAIMQDCFDDIFPTASQLALELEDDELDEDSQRSIHQPPKEFNTIKGVDDRHGAPDGRPHANASALAQEHDTENCSKRHNTESQSKPGAISRPLSARLGGLNSRHQEGASRSFEQTNRVLQPQSTVRGIARSTAGVPPNPMKPVNRVHKTQKVAALHRDLPQQRTPVVRQNKTVSRGILHEVSSNRAASSKPLSAAKSEHHFDEFFPLICTQDLVMSSQEVLDIESPAKADAQPSSGELEGHPPPVTEMDLAAIDWDDDLDDF